MILTGNVFDISQKQTMFFLKKWVILESKRVKKESSSEIRA